MAENEFVRLLASPPAPGSDEARLKAVASLYHALFTGLILMVASRKGPAAVGEWTFRLFRRLHHEKFLSSFDKLGLTGKPHAVAAAQYHYLSNSIGGVEVEFMAERDDKAWVRFCHPRWLYEGATLCGVPVEVSHGFLRGWYSHNGVSLGNPRLGFVCTSQDMTAEYGLAGYFLEHKQDLAPEERLRFAPGEIAPPFEASAAPVLEVSDWPITRLLKANRNYAMDYVRVGLAELDGVFGSTEAEALGGLAAKIIGRQYYRQMQALFGADRVDERPLAFAELWQAFAGTCDDAVEITARGAGSLVMHQRGWRLMRAEPAFGPAVAPCWLGLIEGMASVHNRFMDVNASAQGSTEGVSFTWEIALK